MAITVTLAPELETQVRSVAKQEGLTTNTYIGKLLQRDLYQRRVTVSEAEENLLQQINIGMPEETWQRYHLLITKLEDETLQPDEQQELAQIIDQREEANVRRIDALIKLAQLRNTTLDALIDELGVRPALYV